MRAPIALLFVMAVGIAASIGWMLFGAQRGNRGIVAPAMELGTPGDARSSAQESQAAAADRPEREVAHEGGEDKPEATERGTWLVLRALNAFDGEPLEGVTVKVQATRPIEGQELIEDAISDADGLARVEVPPGVTLGTQAVAGPGRGSARREVPPLAHGEVRTIELRVPVERERVFHGRVVDATDGRALGGVHVVTRDGSSSSFDGASAASISDPTTASSTNTSTVTTDLEGRFKLAQRSIAPARIALRHPGYSELRFEAGDGHEEPERARELHLRLSARLIVRVVGEGGGEPVRVQLSTAGYHLRAPDEPSLELADDGEWRASCAVDEPCTFEELPARVPLDAVLVLGKRLRRIGEPLVLLPGETREVTWSFAGTVLTGRLRRADGEPAHGEGVMLLARDGPPHVTRRALSLFERDQALALATADAEGRFELRGVFPGEYWLGPVPRYDRERRRAPQSGAELVAVTDLPAEREVELVMPSAELFVSGVVLGTDGQPAPGASVLATSERWFRYVESATSAEDGTFRVGPLFPDNVRITANPQAQGPSLEVAAGAENVVLRLHTLTRIAGRVVDGASGAPQAARVAFSSIGGPTLERHSADGAFELELAPGTYAIFATASGGRSGVLHPVVVGGAEPLDDLVLELGQGARLRSRNAPAAQAIQIRAAWRGFSLPGVHLGPGQEALFTVPSGELQLRYGPVGVQPHNALHLHLVPGELRELDLGIE